jgi:hypothetical protein
MTDQFNEQVSEFIDDEMSVEESEFFVRRLQRDPEARHQYLRYQMIGAAMRGEHFHPGAAELGRRLEQAIERDASTARSRAGARLAAGVGIAASVAIVAVFGLRQIYLGPGSDASGASAGLFDAPSYVVPPGPTESAPLVQVGGEVTGIQYLIHHARYTSGVSRTIMQSSVVAGQETDPTEDSEDSEDSEADPVE